MKILVSMFVALIALPVFAGPVCFQNLAEWKKAKTKLPTVLSDLPLFLAHPAGSKLTGAIQVAALPNGSLRFDFTGYHSIGGDQSESNLISKACVDGKTLTLHMISGAEKTAEIASDGSLNFTTYKYLTYNFVKTTSSEFEAKHKEASRMILENVIARAENDQRAKKLNGYR